MKKVKLGKYRHFKGKKYEVIGIAKDSETLEDFVVYRAFYGEKDLWVRPVKMFLEKVEIKGHAKGQASKKVDRFKYIK